MRIILDEFEELIRPIMNEAMRNAAQPTAEQLRWLRRAEQVVV